MKIKIVSIIPDIKEQNVEYNYILISQLDTIENNSCLEIELGDTLDYNINRNDILTSCIQKLRMKGIISLTGLDIIEVAKSLITGALTIDQTNELLYKDKKSIDNLFRIIAHINSLNLKIINKKLSNGIYFIKAVKI